METERSLNFIEQIVENDLKENRNDGRIQTRFPPEPNGYLHIGHVKAICMDFGIAERYGGVCNLRFDDTNPAKEDTEYVDSIMHDIEWLGFKWGHVYYASDYFEKLYELAIRMIKAGKAYVDEQTAEEIAAQKGTPTEPGTNSPYRDRPIEENLRLFEAMQRGEIEDGKMILRAKIDMANPNMHFRDPIMYRIITTHPHHRTGRKWNVYPMYDFAHGQSDYFEGVTHSICTLEFVVHRPLYDYFIDEMLKVSTNEDWGTPANSRPHQFEFNRLNISYTVMSKRKMLQLVKEGLVAGWDDPRMPTVCGLRRRGYTPTAIRKFIDTIGYTKVEGMIDYSWLENAIRDELKETAPRIAGIFDPVKLHITNAEFPDSYIERGDFREEADKDFYRLSPGGREVRLKDAYIIQATGCEKDKDGNITTVYATLDPNSFSGTEGGSRKTKATICWVDCDRAVTAEARLYDRLFRVENPSAEEGDFRELLNPESLVVKNVIVDKNLPEGRHFQFLKHGYFYLDDDSTKEHLIFNRTASLKDNWQK